MMRTNTVHVVAVMVCRCSKRLRCMVLVRVTTTISWTGSSLTSKCWRTSMQAKSECDESHMYDDMLHWFSLLGVPHPVACHTAARPNQKVVLYARLTWTDATVPHTSALPVCTGPYALEGCSVLLSPCTVWHVLGCHPDLCCCSRHTDCAALPLHLLSICAGPSVRYNRPCVQTQMMQSTT